MTTAKQSRSWASTSDLLEKLAQEKARYEALATAAEALLDALAGVSTPIDISVATTEAALRNALKAGDK